MSTTRSRLTRVAVAAGALAVAGGVAAAFAFGRGGTEPGSSYVLGNAATGSVVQTWDTTGTIARKNTVTASFTNVGSVTSVDVQPGDTVTEGQRLATVDTSELNLNVVLARASLTQASAQLTIDKAATTSSSSAASASGSLSVASQLSALSAQLRVLSAQVAAAKVAAAKSQATAAAAVAAQERLVTALAAALSGSDCVATLSGGSGGSSGSSSPSPSASPSASASASASVTATPTDSSSATPTTTGTPTATESPTATATTSSTPSGPSDAQVAACRSALEAVAALGAGTSSPSPAPSPTASPTPSGTPSASASASPTSGASVPSGGSSGSTTGGTAGSAGSASGSSAKSRAARVAADQATVLQAQQDLASAQRNLAAAELTAPISGRVGAVTLVTGQSSGSRSVTVVGEGAAVVTVTAPLSIRPLLTNGEPVTIVAPGSEATVTGTVAQVSHLATSGTAGSPTYAVAITATDPQSLLFEGGVASVTVALGSVDGVTVVPGSAVTPTGVGTGTVQIKHAGSSAATTVDVSTGAVGLGMVQILSGVTAGEAVVLGDLNATVPANSFQRSNRSTSAPTTSSKSAATAVATPAASPSR